MADKQVEEKARTALLIPDRKVLVVDSNGPKIRLPADLSPERIGWKAFGLTLLPAQWVPTFFVVDGKFADITPVPTLQAQIASSLSQLNLTPDRLLVRSSGIAETMHERGRLVSAISDRDAIATTIKSLAFQLASNGIGRVHWVVQEFIPPARKGHLSNERRVSKEKRDWVAEFEVQGDQEGFTTRVAVRRWRDGYDVTAPTLGCRSAIEATVPLKHVALWATRLNTRLHFEWVWSGKDLWIVQLDIASSHTGINPLSLQPSEVPAVELAALHVFRPAESLDFTEFSKLHNASVYRELGYEMPHFFVLHDAATISALLNGDLSPALNDDLGQLTRRPLIIRTDGRAIPDEKHQMLPRSDELRSLEDARAWLLSKFRTAIRANGLESADLCLIAHHFIPSVAAAWARAEPKRRMVRIESLWGLPEGLYWYSHDTFEVDTLDNSPKKLEHFTIRERQRYKGTFVAPDSTGRWIPCPAAPPYDWVRSIRKNAWLREIASTTRHVAEREDYPVAVMWFIDNDHRTTPHRVLPWYHSRSMLGAPKAAPRRKLTVAADFRIETTADWEELKRQVTSGIRIERIVIEPKDANLIRNQQFAEELANFAATHNIVVELAGGILSHAYYMLQRHGVQVECIDLFGAEEEVIEYNKLVRDNIPHLIQGGGEDVEVVRLEGDALLAGLRQKLVEEALEAVDARSVDDLVGELADVQEVINGICAAIHVTGEQLEGERRQKANRRGGFETGTMLKRTSMPRSISITQDSSTELTILNPAQAPRIIQQPTAIPTTPPYRRADLRNVGKGPERLLTFETEVNALGTTRRPTTFSTSMDAESQRLHLTIELSRNRSFLRGTLRVRPEKPTASESQLEFKFDESHAPGLVSTNVQAGAKLQ